MIKINLKKANTILFTISIFVIVIGILCGLYLSGYLAIALSKLPEMNVDGSNLSPFIKVIGYIVLPVISAFILTICVAISVIIDSFIWGLYGLIKLIKEKRWKILVIIAVILIIIILMPIIVSMINTPILEENTIGFIAYDYNSDLGYTVYIEEDNKYIPYLILTYDYNKTNNALVLRKNVVINMTMHNNVKYEENDIDKYLTGEFLTKFDSKFLNKICNTTLSFSEYGYKKGLYHNYEINRQFFILSLTELNSYGAEYDNKTNNKMKLKYFNTDSIIAVNDEGIESPYWTRTSYYVSSYFFVGYDGLVTHLANDEKFGVRPAFTIPNNTKIKKVYDKDLNQDIYVLDF